MVIPFRLVLAAAVLPLSAISATRNPANVDPTAVKNSLMDLGISSPAKQVQWINEAKPQLSPEALIALYENSDEQGKAFLKTLFLNNPEARHVLYDPSSKGNPPFLEELFLSKEEKPELSSKAFHALHEQSPKEGDIFIADTIKTKYPQIEQKLQFIKSLNPASSYSDMLLAPSEKDCNAITNTANPSYIGATPLVDWLNIAHFSGFFNPTMKNTLVNRPCHNDFDTFNQWNLWVEPYGFSTQFRNEPAPLKFDQYTVGVSLGGERTFFDRLVLGLGLAYSHSGVEWKEIESHANINTLYFGPALNYVFSQGYLGCTLFGAANFYHMDRKTDLFPGKADPQDASSDYTSWDLVARFEGGFSLSPGYQFFLYPMARIDYLTVFENGSEEQLDKNTNLSIDGFIESFLCSKVGVKLTREFYSPSFGLTIPNLSFGWMHFSPLSIKDYQFHVRAGENLVHACENRSARVEPQPWNQWTLGAGLTLILKKALLISLDYELTAGADSPLQAGSLRFELSW